VNLNVNCTFIGSVFPVVMSQGERSQWGTWKQDSFVAVERERERDIDTSDTSINASMLLKATPRLVNKFCILSSVRVISVF
jgi:hypothetical protein